IFVKGEVIKTVPEDQIVTTLLAEANRIAAGTGADSGAGSVAVTVSCRRAGAAQSRHAVVAAPYPQHAPSALARDPGGAQPAGRRRAVLLPAGAGGGGAAG